MSGSWDFDKTWKLIQAHLEERQEKCLRRILDRKTTHEETIELRAEHGLIRDLLKLPETLEARAANRRG